MRVAVMQPYLFPYIGYFQLITAVDTFVFYDDVNFKKKGFINKNFILMNNNPYRFTIPCKDISQNKLIKDTKLDFDDNAKSKFLDMLKHAYSKAPYYKETALLVSRIICQDFSSIALLAITGIKDISNYLDINVNFKVSSINHFETKNFSRQDRLIEIVKQELGNEYVNMIGGQDLYQSEPFLNEGIQLNFLNPGISQYRQFDGQFCPSLSIIDVLMFNSVGDIQNMLCNYKLC